MKRKKKKIMILSVVAVIFVALIIYQIGANNKQDIENKYVTILSDGSKVNISEALNEDRTYAGLKIENIHFSYAGQFSIFEFEAYNPTSNIFPGQKVIIHLLTEEDELVQTILGDLPELASNERVKLNFAIDLDVVDVHDILIDEYTITEEDLELNKKIAIEE